jgi:hypothetical protein
MFAEYTFAHFVPIHINAIPERGINKRIVGGAESFSHPLSNVCVCGSIRLLSREHGSSGTTLKLSTSDSSCSRYTWRERSVHHIP